MRYLITFACYGAHLHGDESGSVDRRHNRPGARLVDPNPKLEAAERRAMGEAPYRLDDGVRRTVLAAVRAHCEYRGWKLWAAHVRTNHVHAVVEAETPPERVMTEFKAYASRAINQTRRDESNRKRWARHGSTRWLRCDQDVRNAVRYVVEEQGAPMAVFVAEDW